MKCLSDLSSKTPVILHLCNYRKSVKPLANTIIYLSNLAIDLFELIKSTEWTPDIFHFDNTNFNLYIYITSNLDNESILKKLIVHIYQSWENLLLSDFSLRSRKIWVRYMHELHFAFGLVFHSLISELKEKMVVSQSIALSSFSPVD